MISLSGYNVFIWGIFSIGWIGAGIIAVAAILELVKMFSVKNKET